MSCNIDCGAIPIKVPTADAFIPYVNRAEIAAEEAEKNAQQAKEAVESITDISNQVEQVQQLAQQAKESEVNASASAQIASTKANEAAASAKISEDKANEYAKEAKEYVDSINTSNLAKLTDNNTFDGINTFNNTINVPTPTDNNNAVNKNYVDTEYLRRRIQFNSKKLSDFTNEGIYLISGTFEDCWIEEYQAGKMLVLNSSVNGESGINGAWIFQFVFTAYKDIWVRRRINTEDWSSWKQIAYTQSPQFTGYPTAPTQYVTDNSTHIATTAFVKAQSANMQVSTLNTNNNYWTKDPSGLVHQFAKVDATTEEITIPFPISFPSKCLCVMIEILNPDKDISKNVSFNIIEKNVDGIKLLKIGNGNPTITVTAIGA